MSLQRPLVRVFSADKGAASGNTVPLPDVFSTPIRTDIVDVIHNFLRMNLRQPYAVSKYAGHDYSAESWGTGRAVARIPRVSGGGTHRAGQGAFGNMCRGGRMFSPTRVWRRWSHKISTSQKRFATAAAIAASSVTPLVMARGHKVERIQELPLVVADDVQAINKTKAAVKFLKAVKAFDDVRKVKNSKKIRAGKGKYRNRKYKARTGPLVIYKENKGIVRGFRNLPGVDLLSVDRLNLLKLAPGGQVGRFVIWTESAFKALQARFGSVEGKTGSSSLKQRNGSVYRLPRPQMANTDVLRIIESDSVQAALRPVKLQPKRRVIKKNPLKNFYALVKLNPYALKQRRATILSQVAGQVANAQKQKKQQRAAKAQEAFFNKQIAPVLAQ